MKVDTMHRYLTIHEGRLWVSSSLTASYQPSGCIWTPQLRMNKNSLLNQIYICPIGADGVHS
jgi:hypothetical protein